jgi:hypothetical protein
MHLYNGTRLYAWACRVTWETPFSDPSLRFQSHDATTQWEQHRLVESYASPRSGTGQFLNMSHCFFSGRSLAQAVFDKLVELAQNFISWSSLYRFPQSLSQTLLSPNLHKSKGDLRISPITEIPHSRQCGIAGSGVERLKFWGLSIRLDAPGVWYTHWHGTDGGILASCGCF